ncbi:M13 family metallopeptidase [Nocardia sp. NPDC052566]|uniref:M13 family metallopeptidase n=1 Tax=Nocardia sp. NPDC052566 TaxID=3364330 RepID=UPI0037C578D9
MTADRLFSPDRRTFLTALGLLPAAAVLASCGSKDSTAKTLTGPDMSGSDPAIRPQDDLYRHINGTWLRDYRLPPDKSSYGTFAEVRARVERQLRDIVDGIHNPRANTPEQQIRDMYDAYLDVDEIEKLGMTPLQGYFTKIDAAATKADLARTMGELPIPGLIGLEVTTDDKNSSRHIASISQSGIGLDEQYYRKPEYAEKLAAYRTYLERLSAAAGFADSAATAGRVFDLERRIAAGFWDSVRMRDPQALYNIRSWSELAALAPGFDWNAWLAGRTDRPLNLFDQVLVRQPSFVGGAGQLWAEVDLPTWRDYLRLSLVRTYAQYLKKDIATADFDFTGKVMQGLQQQPERWKAAIDTVNKKVGPPLGKLYVAQHFPPAAKQLAEEMVRDLMAVYRESFTNSAWMSAPTKAAAIAKLEKIAPKIGYPDQWEDYSGLRILRGRLVESLFTVDAFDRKRMFDRLGTPVDRSRWELPPQTVNAFYEPVRNEIMFPAGILQAPFFDKDAEPAVNYGGGGAVIGHEIGHGFDDQGAQYDGDGNLHDWWTPADKAAFEAKTKALIAQYDALIPEGLPSGAHVNGALTVGENLADLRGLDIALSAYQLVSKRKGTENPDYKPMFESWGRIWRIKQTDQTLESQLAQDPHSPGQFRCNQVVRNLPQYYSTFDVKEGDKMYLPPDQRVSL